MDPEANRSFENLLLLCRDHHAAVDDPTNVTSYSEEVLLLWKQKQVELGAGRGAVIDDREAEQIAHQIANYQPIVISAVHLNLGGAGGAAMGAAGGGGGAIGAGAHGGPGGSVGRIDLHGLSGGAPGAGGGGGGSLDLAALAWSEAERQVDVEGQGGVYGIDGGHGGDTTLGDASGNILLRAAGGEGGMAVIEQRGTHPGLRVSALTAGEFIRTEAGGLVTAVAVGWSWITALNLPADVGLPLLMYFEAGGVPTGSYTIRLSMTDPGGTTAGEMSFPLTVDRPGRVLRIPFHGPFRFHVSQYGVFTLAVASDIGELASLDFVVKRVAL